MSELKLRPPKEELRRFCKVSWKLRRLEKRRRADVLQKDAGKMPALQHSSPTC